jgi:hypothetical protein
MKVVLFILAVCTFIIVAFLGFFVDSTTARDLIGGIALGSAFFAGGHLPIP